MAKYTETQMDAIRALAAVKPSNITILTVKELLDQAGELVRYGYSRIKTGRFHVSYGGKLKCTKAEVLEWASAVVESAAKAKPKGRAVPAKELTADEAEKEWDVAREASDKAYSAFIDAKREEASEAQILILKTKSDALSLQSDAAYQVYKAVASKELDERLAAEAAAIAETILTDAASTNTQYLAPAAPVAQKVIVTIDALKEAKANADEAAAQLEVCHKAYDEAMENRDADLTGLTEEQVNRLIERVDNTREDLLYAIKKHNKLELAYEEALRDYETGAEPVAQEAPVTEAAVPTEEAVASAEASDSTEEEAEAPAEYYELYRDFNPTGQRFASYDEAQEALRPLQNEYHSHIWVVKVDQNGSTQIINRRCQPMASTKSALANVQMAYDNNPGCEATFCFTKDGRPISEVYTDYATASDALHRVCSAAFSGCFTLVMSINDAKAEITRFCLCGGGADCSKSAEAIYSAEGELIAPSAWDKPDYRQLCEQTQVAPVTIDALKEAKANADAVVAEAKAALAAARAVAKEARSALAQARRDDRERKHLANVAKREAALEKRQKRQAAKEARSALAQARRDEKTRKAVKRQAAVVVKEAKAAKEAAELRVFALSEGCQDIRDELEEAIKKAKDAMEAAKQKNFALSAGLGDEDELVEALMKADDNATEALANERSVFTSALRMHIDLNAARRTLATMA